MAVSALKKLLRVALGLLLVVQTANACFGPKIFIGTAEGLEGEMRYHLIAIYVHEKTGIDSTRVVLQPGQSALEAIAAEEIDLGFDLRRDTDTPVLLQLKEDQSLYSGPRPLNDLQFSTLSRALEKLNQRLTLEHLAQLRREIDAGVLPATAVRNLMQQQGWI
jgi:hypothetical protein